METVGAATWSHTLRSLKPGGRVVIAGATSGSQPPADLSRVFFQPLSVVGSTMVACDGSSGSWRCARPPASAR